MSDFSDDADIKSEEMARMVEDLEELDNTLLGGSLKKPDLFSATSNDKDKEGTEGKKKVAFKGKSISMPPNFNEFYYKNKRLFPRL